MKYNYKKTIIKLKNQARSINIIDYVFILLYFIATICE